MYNNNFVPNYYPNLQNPYYNPPTQMTQQSQSYNSLSVPTNSSNRIWVASQAQAEAYLVAPNDFVQLWDSSRPTFYEKQCDSTGKPLPMIIYDYKRRETPQQTEQQNNIPIENNDFEQRFNQLEERIKLLENSAELSVNNSKNKNNSNKKGEE